MYHKTPEDIVIMQKKAIAGGVTTPVPVKKDEDESPVEVKKVKEN